MKDLRHQYTGLDLITEGWGGSEKIKYNYFAQFVIDPIFFTQRKSAPEKSSFLNILNLNI